MADGFVPSIDEGEFEAAAAFEQQPIDPDNPGFASLLPALAACRNGEIEPAVLTAYIDGLWPRLEQAFDEWERVIGEQVGQLQGEQADAVRDAYATTGELLRTMGETLSLIEQGLVEDDDALLAEAQDRLAGVHGEVQQALG